MSIMEVVLGKVKNSFDARLRRNGFWEVYFYKVAESLGLNVVMEFVCEKLDVIYIVSVLINFVWCRKNVYFRC